MATWNFGDDFVVRETVDGEYEIQHEPSGETVTISEDGLGIGNDEYNTLDEWGGLVIDDEHGIQYFAGGRWVTTGEDPAEQYPELVNEGHHWIEVDE